MELARDTEQIAYDFLRLRCYRRFRVTDKASLLNALQNATAGQVIYIESQVEIDLTGERDLYIPEQVTLAGNRGQDGSAGPHLQCERAGVGAALPLEFNRPALSTRRSRRSLRILGQCPIRRLRRE